MNTAKKKKTTTASQEEIDRLVVSQSEDESAWESPLQVSSSKPASLSIPGELSAPAAFLAKLQGEAGLGKWVERIVRERVEPEEFAFRAA